MARSSLCINDVLSHYALVEVLIRIPFMDAFRCRSVCKLWLSVLRDDPSFISLFILHRIKKQPLNKEDHYQQKQQQLIYAPCSVREMLLVTPTCNIPTKALTLYFLPFFPFWCPPDPMRLKRVVVGCSNGLLLCSPLCERPAVYYICNPLTKQWLTLPPSPHGDRSGFDVGFVSDPFYNVEDEDARSVTLNHGFSFTVVRQFYHCEDEKQGLFWINAEVFSSKTGSWTTSTVQCSKRITASSTRDLPRTAIPYGGKLHWLLEPCDILIYDPSKNEYVLNRLDPPLDAALRGLSQCRGSLWAGQAYEARLRVFVLLDGEWCLHHDVHMLRDLEWLSGSSSMKFSVEHHSRSVEFWTMHPSDPMIAYLVVRSAVVECHFGDRTLKVIAENDEEGKVFLGREWSNVLTFHLPLWPTPLPTLPSA